MPMWMSAAWRTLIGIVVRAEQLAVGPPTALAVRVEGDRVVAPGADRRVERLVVLARLDHDRHPDGVPEDHRLLARVEPRQDRLQVARATDPAEDRLDVAVVVELAGDPGADLREHLVVDPGRTL